MKEINCHNLHEATAQEVFDAVATHLLTQNKKAIDEDTLTCRYRGANNTKCAAGILISDSEYRPDVENLSMVGAFNLIMENLTTKAIPHESLLLELQSCHDALQPDEWKDRLQIIAETNNLNTNILNNFSNAT